MKKLLATILALIMALSLCTVAFADDEVSVTMTSAEFAATADASGTITMTSNVELSNQWKIDNGAEYTLNLNGYTLSRASSVILIVNGKITVNGPGTIKETAPDYGAIRLKGSTTENDANYSIAVVNKDVVLEAWAPIFIDQNDGKAYGVSVTVNGATLNGKKDQSGASGCGVYVNGQITHTVNMPVINLTNTTINGEGSDAECNGMYLAGCSDTTLTNCAVTGNTGIEIRAGKLTVNGGSISATAAPTSVTPNGNGSTSDGAGIAVAQHTTKLPVIVKINSGTISGYSALYQSNPEGNSTEDIAKVQIDVAGGTYTATNGGTVAVYSENKTGFISGGTFSDNSAGNYLAEDVAFAGLTKGTTFIAGEGNINAVAQMGNDVTVLEGDVAFTNVPSGTVITNNGSGDVTVNGSGRVTEGNPYTVPARYYYNSTTTTKDTGKTSSPKTFDAGMGIYALTAVLSVTGMAYVGKKKF